jgi:hypothetical protein
MYFGKLPFGAAVATEAFLDVVHELSVFDGLLEPISTDTVLDNELRAELSDRSILRNR